MAKKAKRAAARKPAPYNRGIETQRVTNAAARLMEINRGVDAKVIAGQLAVLRVEVRVLTARAAGADRGKPFEEVLAKALHDEAEAILAGILGADVTRTELERKP